MSEIEESDDSIICYVSDWKELTSDGPRNKGEKYRSRFAVVALTNCYGLVEYRDSGTCVYHRYASSFADLCAYFRTDVGVRLCDGLNSVITSLQKSCPNEKLDLVDAKASVHEIFDIARKIDNQLKTDYAIYNDVRERLYAK